VRAPSLSVVIVFCAACGGNAGSGSVVSAPAAYSSPAAVTSAGAAGVDASSVCGRPWNLDVIGGNGQIVVVCSSDVRRQALDPTTASARALFAALDPTRERVCACVARLRSPEFVDLVFTAKPEEGRTTVQAAGDDDLDPVLGPPFVACVGTIAVAFAPLSSDACASGKASLVYPVRLELGRDPSEGEAP
jgi:hypothetical protein